jgi:hypothetical protein
MNDKLIWIMREPRTGSTWITDALAKKLNKTICHYEMQFDKNLELDITAIDFQDHSKLYSTHLFNLIPKVKEIDPYIIRTARRNKTEQCLSMLYWNHFPKSIKHYFVDESRNANMDYFTRSLDNPVTVNKESVFDILVKIKKRDRVWEDNFQHFTNDVIVYEDLFDEVYLSNLDIKLSFSEETNFSYRMPEYKTKAFANYDQIIEWCDDFISKMNFIQY